MIGKCSSTCLGNRLPKDRLQPVFSGPVHTFKWRQPQPVPGCNLPTGPVQLRSFSGCATGLSNTKGHRQINCPHYHCRICSNTAPGHLTAFCPYLSGRKIIKAKPRSWDFYDQLKKYEDLRDKEMEEIENSYHAERQYDDIEYEDLNYDHNLYDNTDN